MLNQVYFWTAIRKNRSKYNLTRGISEDDVTAILFRDVIVKKDPQLAELSLLKVPGLRKFNDGLKTNGEKEHFRRHLRKYVNIWLPDCPFEVSTTNRYTIITNEAATTARRYIKKGDSIKYLCGHLVSITTEEEKDLDISKRDFSIVMSTRKKTPSLFLGPARFANHDCNANARLVTQGSKGMQIVAVRNIQLGEEITVTYGDDYFGERNCECLCMTCEKEARNGWSSPLLSGRSTGMVTPLVEPEIVDARPYSFRKIKKRTELAESLLPMTPDTDEGGTRKRRGSDRTRSPSSLSLSSTNTQLRPVDVKIEPSRSVESDFLSIDNIARSGPGPCTRKTQPASKISSQSTQDEDVLRASVKAAFASVKDSKMLSRGRGKTFISRASSSSPLQQRYTHLSRLEKVTKPPTLLITPATTPSAPSDVDSIFDSHNAFSSSAITTPSVSLETSVERKDFHPSFGASSASELSELSSNESFDEIRKNIIRKRKKRQPKSQKPKIVQTIETDSIDIRYPGDYTRTPLLLGESYSRWVDCRTCTECWVQQNGYLTRKECPRCERHSKLYGYQWPKTDKTGKGDNEQRIMDHRTVHRFIKPEEEAMVKKRGRGIERAKSGAIDQVMSPPIDDASDVSSVKRVKRSWRGRGSTMAS